MSAPEVVVITGMSGAGRTEALHALEDAGFYCIDNLPPTMLTALVEQSGLRLDANRRLAVVCDLRSHELFDKLCGELDRLRERGVSCSVVYLDADDDTARLSRSYRAVIFSFFLITCAPFFDFGLCVLRDFPTA